MCRRYHMHNCSTLSEMNDKGENIITQIPGGLFQSSKPSDPTKLQYQSMIFVVKLRHVKDPMKLLDKQSFLPN